MLTIIDRYIAKSFLLYFLAGLLVFVTTFLTVDFMSSMVRYDVTTATMIKFYGFLIPSIIYQMIPVACLLSTLFTLSGLNRNSELVALFSMGMSLARISAPILSMVAVVGVISFWMGDRIMPSFMQKKNYVYYTEIKKRPGLYSTVKTDKIWYRSENVLFNIQALSSTESKAQGMTLYYFNSNWDLTQLIRAQEVLIKGKLWELQNGSITLFVEDASFPLTKDFDKKSLTMSEELADIKSTAHSSEVQSVNQLKKYITKNKEAGLDTLRYEVDFHSRFSFALAGFVLALMGIPFASGHHRQGGGFVNVGICLLLALVYWILYSSSLNLGKNGMITPIVAAWTPNILMIGTAVYFLLRQKK